MNRNKIMESMKQIGRIALACVLALVLGGLFLMTQGHSPFESYGVIFSKAFASFDQVLRRMTPLMLTSLAVDVYKRQPSCQMKGIDSCNFTHSAHSDITKKWLT